MTTRQELGQWGEEKSCQWLREVGYEILTRNYRCRYGEIDIVAREKGDLVFVEVKTRRSTSFGHPTEAVGRRKKQSLTRVALHYLMENPEPEVNCRFDVMAVYPGTNGKPVRVELFRNAFTPDSDGLA